jgi:hypothetical protein
MSIELMENLLEKVDKILDKANLPERHTFYQIQKFIIGKEPTGQAQLWAIVRELQARRDSVEAIKKDLRDAEDNLELLDLKIERLNRQIREDAKSEGPFTDLNIQEHEINIRKLQREKEALVAAARKVNKKLKSILEEMDFLAKGFELVLSQVGEMKPIDDEEAQKEMWNEKLLEEFNLRVILQRPLDPEFIKTVMCLHDEAVVKKHVVNLVENIQKKMIAEHQVNAQRTSIEAKPRVIGG